MQKSMSKVANQMYIQTAHPDKVPTAHPNQDTSYSRLARNMLVRIILRLIGHNFGENNSRIIGSVQV